MTLAKLQKAIISFLGIAAVILFALVQHSCATESSPSGGKEDKDPPKAKSITPPDQSTHFTGKQVEIKFDEFIQNSGFSHVLTSPEIDPKPVFQVHGKKLLIKFKEELKPNTTYTINFGDDIKDVNQGNVLSNFTYVFSTGDYIDSQQVSGKVSLAKDGSAAEDYLVVLYPEDKPEDFLKTRPVYFSKTTKDGSFQMKNIKAARYNIFALKDQNFNYYYDIGGENIAFSDSILDLTDTLPKQVSLRAFNEGGKRKLKLQNVKNPEAGKLVVAYSGPFDYLKLDSKLFENGYFTWFYDTRDTAIVWYSNTYIKKDSIYLVANDTLQDTARMELKFINRDSITANPKYQIQIENQSIRAVNDSSIKSNFNIQELYGLLKIPVTRPILEINKSKRLQILADSTKKTMEADFDLDEKTHQRIEFNFAREEKTDYTVTIPDSTFKDVFGLWNKPLTWKFRTNEKSSYGNIHLNVKSEKPGIHYIVNLYNSNNEIVRTFFVPGSQKIDVNTMLSGNYKVGAVEDLNHNGRWDTGNLLYRRQPEPVINFQDTYTLKGGWDLEIEVKL